MKVPSLHIISSIVVLFFWTASADAQGYWTGIQSTSSTITRTGNIALGSVLFRPSPGNFVFEHTGLTGNLYLRSIAYNNANDAGDLILNDVGGNVGIGSANPDMKLSVYTDGSLISRFHSTGTGLISGVRLGRTAAYADLVNLSSGFGIGAGTSSGNLPMGVQDPAHIDLFIHNTSNNVGIGTTTPDSKLTVNGNIHAREVKVDLAGAVAPDYVFEEGYSLRSLEELQAYITEKGHLPGIPSAEEMEKEGINLKEMNLKLLEKVEELTLYVLQQRKIIKNQESAISGLREAIETIKK